MEILKRVISLSPSVAIQCCHKADHNTVYFVLTYYYFGKTFMNQVNRKDKPFLPIDILPS